METSESLLQYFYIMMSLCNLLLVFKNHQGTLTVLASM